MTIPKESPFSFYISPIKQGLVIIVIMVLLILLFQGPDPKSSWTIAASMTLLFSIGNSILSLSARDLGKYWGQSIFTYIIVVLIGMGLAWSLTGQSIDEMSTFKWMYLVFTFCYLLLLSIVQIMRKIMKLAQDQDAALRGE